MRESHHDADAVRGREELQPLADADEAGVVGVIVLDVAVHDAEPVELRTVAGGDAGDVRAVGARDALRGDSGVGAGRDLRGGEILRDVRRTLPDGLLVGEDLLDVAALHSLLCEQVMADLQLDAAHNVEVVLFHEVVHGVDAAHRAVLNGEDAVVAQPLFHRLEHPLEIAEEGDVRDLEQLVRGDGGVAPFHALTCDGRGDGEISLALHERASELVGEGEWRARPACADRHARSP